MKDNYTAAEFIEMMKKGTFNSKGRLIVPEGFEVPSTPKKKTIVTIPTINKGKDFIRNTIIQLKVNYCKEYKFLPNRKFRFDYYLPDYKVGIEYDGIFSDKSRHTSIVGFSRDTDKTNLAQLAGFKILRYTAKNYKDFFNHLITIINDNTRT